MRRADFASLFTRAKQGGKYAEPDQNSRWWNFLFVLYLHALGAETIRESICFA